ncbi:MAG: hypothetical protein ABSG99_04535, partial [Sedimentisphaerales bacterium]
PLIVKPRAFLNGASPPSIQLCTRWKKPDWLKADGDLRGSLEKENIIILLTKAGSYSQRTEPNGSSFQNV